MSWPQGFSGNPTIDFLLDVVQKSTQRLVCEA